jgi:arabinosaccharide transport system substrate-binding protein
MKKTLSRRDFLKLAGATTAGLAISQVAPLTPAMALVARRDATPILMWFQAENHAPEYDRRKAELEEKFGVAITFEILGREAMTEKFPATLMAGEGFPDIIEQNADDIIKFLKGDDRAIPFIALNETIDNGPYANDVLESRWARYTKDGNRYGAPHDVHPIVMLYHSEAWAEFDVDMEAVETWEDFLAACQVVGETAEMEDGRPRYAYMDCATCAGLLTLMLQNGVWWHNEAGDMQIGEPGFRAAIETLLMLDPYRVDIDWGNQVAMFKDGQYLTALTPDWLYGIHKQGTAEDTEWLADSPIRIRQMPSGPATGSWGGTAASVTKPSKVAEKALELLMYLYFDNTEGQLAQRFVDIGILPPVVSAWDDPIFNEPEPYTGGQVAGQAFQEAAKNLPAYYESWKTSLIAAAWGEQATLLFAGEIGIDEAIEAAVKRAAEDIERQA